ncbi:MAG: hypothetical protein E7B14_11910 [Clostridium sp.]|nr:hypothetical protein [Clostridium sp.]
MKKIIRSSMVSIAIILFLNIPSIVLALDLSAKDINDIKYQLRIVGINSMKNLSLSREELLVIEKECTEVINLIHGKNFISDLSLSEMYYFYKTLSSIINNLNMGFSINIFNKSIAIKNISNGDILMKGSIKEVGGYIENVKRNNSIKDIVNILDRIEFKILGENSGFSNKVLNSNIPDFAINVINEFEWVLNF